MIRKLNNILAISLSIIMILSTVGCGSQSDVTATPTTEEVQESINEETQVAEEANNLLDNGDFHSEMAHWGTYISKGGVGDMVAPAGEGKVVIKKSGNTNYAIQAYYDGFELKQGIEYELAFDMYSTIERSVEVRVQVNGGDYHAYAGDLFQITGEYQRYTLDFVMEEGSDPAPRMCFNMGTPEGMDDLGEHSVFIDNVSLSILDASGVREEIIEDRSVDVNVNQVGFLKNSRKTAVIRTAKPGTTFTIVDESGNTVYSGELSSEMASKGAGEKVYQADFSDFCDEGTYTVVSEDGISSYPFVIADDVYDELLKDSFLFLYSQRCGIETDEELVGEFAHGACHTGRAKIYGTTDSKMVQGGWHDAGDYGRYVVPGVVTVADLFRTYEECSELWNSSYGDSTGIPESGNGIPDILDEAKFELDFLLQMQDEESGAVYHKISCYDFPGFIMPDKEKEELVLSPVSNTATADFAAIMAWAYKEYKGIDSEWANTALEAAKKAWQYLETSPTGTGYRNPDDILTGEYPDSRDPDERYFAAIELYDATGDDVYRTYFEEILDTYVMHGYGWARMNSYGNMAYLDMDASKKSDKYVEAIELSICEEADKILEIAEGDGYMCSLEEFSWGSNMTVCNNARILIDAYSISGDERYATAAYNQLSYILGQNAVSYCFVTGFGSVFAMHAHHRPSMATGYVFPGMLVGGPNQNKEDPFAKATMGSLSPAKCYADSDQSYSTNEVTIYWNSPFIYLLSYEMKENK